MENTESGKEKVINTRNHKKEESPDKNYRRKEYTMHKTAKTGRGRYALVAALAVVVLIAASGLIAQPMFAEAKNRSGPPGSADEVMQVLTERLELTPEQVDAVRPIIEEKVKTQYEIWGKKDADRRARRAEMRKLRWNTEIRLSEILTDEQVDKYLELRQEQRKEFKRGRHRGGWMKKGMHKTPEQVMERLRSRLDLSEEQAVQAEPIIKESIEKRRAVFEKYAEQGLKVKQAMRSEMQEIGDATHADLAAFLNDQQKDELNAIKEERRARADKWIDHRGSRGF